MKTADEMLQEIGIEKAFEDSEVIEYKEKAISSEKPICFWISKTAKTVTAYSGKKVVYLEFPEVVAFAKLIDELEGNGA